MSAVDLRPRSHAVLERLVLFRFRLTCRTGLHIGAGKSADLVGSDLPILRDAAGRPLVPGSSLRGVLRAAVEALSRSLDLDAVWRAGVPPEPDGSAEPAAGASRQLSFAEEWSRLSLVERLFGRVPEKGAGFSLGSRLQISDAVAVDAVAVELRDGVGIDRETRTAKASVKYDLEVVPAGTVFEGRIRFKNPADYELGLIAQALSMLDQGAILLGGKSARGLGWVEVSATPPRDLTARSLLDGLDPESPEPTFDSIDAHFASVLEQLRALATAALGTASAA